MRQSPLEDNRRKRPKSAKGDRRPFSRDGRMSASTPGDATFRTMDVDTINERGVQDLFSDILYETAEENSEEYKDDFENDDDENIWSEDSHHSYQHKYPLSANSVTARKNNLNLASAT